jgi:hypothetical protein
MSPESIYVYVYRPIVAKQRLGRKFPWRCRATVRRKRYSSNEYTPKNRMLGASFCVLFASYEGKEAAHPRTFFPEEMILAVAWACWWPFLDIQTFLNSAAVESRRHSTPLSVHSHSSSLHIRTKVPAGLWNPSVHYNFQISGSTYRFLFSAQFVALAQYC